MIENTTPEPIDFTKLQIVNGTIILFKNLIPVLLTVTVLSTVVLLIIAITDWQHAEEQEKAVKKKKIFKIVFGCIVALSAQGLLYAILANYGFRVNA